MLPHMSGLLMICQYNLYIFAREKHQGGANQRTQRFRNGKISISTKFYSFMMYHINLTTLSNSKSQ